MFKSFHKKGQGGESVSHWGIIVLIILLLLFLGFMFYLYMRSGGEISGMIDNLPFFS